MLISLPAVLKWDLLGLAWNVPRDMSSDRSPEVFELKLTMFFRCLLSESFDIIDFLDHALPRATLKMISTGEMH